MYTFKVLENITNSSDIISNEALTSSMAPLLQQQRVISETAESLWLRKNLSYRSSSSESSSTSSVHYLPALVTGTTIYVNLKRDFFLFSLSVLQYYRSRKEFRL